MSAYDPMEPGDIPVQLNTRVVYRTRNQLDNFIRYMNKPLSQRPPETEEWPSSIVDILEDALTTFFAEHPMNARKGPDRRTLTKKEKK